MLRFLRRVNTSISDGANSSLSSPLPTTSLGGTRKEFLVQYVGNGGPEEPLASIQAGSNIHKGCSLVVDGNCLLLRELTDVVLLRATAGQIEQCVHHLSGPGKLSNYVSVIIRQDSSLRCHVFETCSVKEVSV